MGVAQSTISNFMWKRHKGSYTKNGRVSLPSVTTKQKEHRVVFAAEHQNDDQEDKVHIDEKVFYLISSSLQFTPYVMNECFGWLDE